MGAGVPQSVINRAISKRVTAAFNEYKGERIEGKGAATTASGVYAGIVWSLSYRTLRASNGEVAILPVITLDGVPVEAYCFTVFAEALAAAAKAKGR